MEIFAIGDLHLSGNPPQKTMEIFGDHWKNHWNAIRRNWQDQVRDDDVVLLAGDTSWAMKLPDALVDLESIRQLPGKKVIIRGNHDYWWQTVSKMTQAVRGEIFFLHNNYYAAGSWAVCGSRGWLCPQEPSFTEEDTPIYQRELLRLETSLQAARRAGFANLLVMLHYPPFTPEPQANPLTALLAKYQVFRCVYGHLHDESIKLAFNGSFQGIDYRLVSCDALNFSLLRLLSV
ncbi:MAG TPA: metallophosphoesterase [Patescibacteria group bacterium]|nr:metallophosphoesterase [Patescibacteria group bacterium]